MRAWGSGKRRLHTQEGGGAASTRGPGDGTEGACTTHSSQTLSLAPPEPLGADAFLPALTEELIWSPDIGETQLDVEFLMELLDPEELLGEGEPASPERQDPTVGRPEQQAGKLQGPSVELRRPLCLSPAGYYLTTWFGALHHIAHYQPEAGRAPQGLSSEARASLRQWHRRRTLHGQDRTGAQVTIRQTEVEGRAGLVAFLTQTPASPHRPTCLLRNHGQ